MTVMRRRGDVGRLVLEPVQGGPVGVQPFGEANGWVHLAVNRLVADMVDCPWCGAQFGQQCIGSGTEPHMARKRAFQLLRTVARVIGDPSVSRRNVMVGHAPACQPPKEYRIVAENLIPDASEHPTIPIKQFAEALGISRPTAYAAVRRGDFEAVRIGNKWLVLVAPLRRKLKMDPEVVDDE